MDAKTHIESPLPRRHMTEDRELTLRDALCSARELVIPQRKRPVASLELRANEIHAVEIFKKTPYRTDLKQVSRYVAKDILEVANIPLLTTTLLDHSRSRGACLPATEQVIAEKMKPVAKNSHQDVFRSADRLITIGGDVVGSKGNLAFDIFDTSADAAASDGAAEGGFNVKLTDKELAGHPTKRMYRATNHTSGTLWKYAPQVVGWAMGDAASKPGRAHEKYCYADI